MSAIKKFKLSLIAATCFLPALVLAAASTPALTEENIAQQLGWVASPKLNDCGGYYLEPAFTYPEGPEKANTVGITSKQTLFSQHSTSILEGKVTVTRFGQQMTANKAFLYRDPNTGKLSSLDLLGDVHLREPNTLVIGKTGHYDFTTKAKSLINILYRTVLSGRQVVGPKVSHDAIQQDRQITDPTAWGNAYEFAQSEPKVYELSSASFSTCPPISPAWRVKASRIVLNKNTGRGYATNARFMLKSIPVFYSPYLSFSIDRQRKSGFLWPTFGISTQWGPYIQAPYYWNIAPNYDMTITPGYLSKDGTQLSDKFRYLTSTSSGQITATILPNDRGFADFQNAMREQYAGPQDDTIQAELNRLLSDSNTRKSITWQDNSRYSPHWSSHIDFNYAGDDYYMRNFGNLNEVTQNQLLQEADLYYRGQYWNFTGRMQAYQTLHPVNEPSVDNNYRRLPQLILNGDFPDQKWGLNYFINNEVTHFDILNTPGINVNQPIGNRLYTQPGVSLPMSWSWAYINPRLQLSLTDYNLYQNSFTQTPASLHRALPIFDVASGMSFNRSTSLFNQSFQQTLEPQLYYTYIPYRFQSNIPVFDTTLNTLTYDQLFNYNRFTGIDRIGDANQVGLGVTSRFIDEETGLEKVRLGLGDIVYFANRRVTLCTTTNTQQSCSDSDINPHSSYQRFSPLSGLLNYNVNSLWSLTGNAIWNPTSKQLDNTTLDLHYQPDANRLINLGYGYARGGNPYSGASNADPSSNLKVTSVSFAWPAVNNVSAVGLWSQNWNHAHLQNVLYGLQYDTCCWATNVVWGKVFLYYDTNDNNKPKYDGQVLFQISLKGLGDITTGRASGLLNSITGYHSRFGQV